MACLYGWQVLCSAATGFPFCRGHERAANPTSIRFLYRHRSPFRQQGHSVSETGACRLWHPVSAVGPWRPGDSGDHHASGRDSVPDRPDARGGVGRNGGAPAVGADRARHRQRHCRAEYVGSAHHGRQRRAVRLPDPERGRCQETDGPPALPEGPAADLADAGRQADCALPVRSFKVTYSISFDHPLLRHQTRTMRITDETFVEEIAPARTFGF